jgi:hypothetical protein
VALSEFLAHVEPSEQVAPTQDLVRIPSVVKPGNPTMTQAELAASVNIEERFDTTRIYITSSLNLLEVV